MGISYVPGVGPTNADIATAVAAPSAATIASTVAASVPTLSQINTAVNTQTNNSAIASAVAGAVPNLSQINTAVANNSSPFGGSWVNVGVTSPSGVNSISFSGLSGYRYYRLFVAVINLTGSCNLQLRLNSDSSASYSYGNGGGSSGNILRNATELNLAGGGVVSPRDYIIDFPSANSTSVDKMMFTVQGSLNANHASAGGVWANTSAINRIDLFLSGLQNGDWYARLIGTN